jgi:hypothetical protein
MKVSIFIAVILFAMQFHLSAAAAIQPSGVPAILQRGKINNINLSQFQPAAHVNITSPESRVKRRGALKQRLMVGLLKYKFVRKIIGIDEPTPKQRKLGRLSLIFGVAAILLVVIPYAALAIPAAFAVASFPLAVAGLILGIKSIKGNTNTMGLIGLILSGAFLLLLILSVLLLAVFFSNWN